MPKNSPYDYLYPTAEPTLPGMHSVSYALVIAAIGVILALVMLFMTSGKGKPDSKDGEDSPDKKSFGLVNSAVSDATLDVVLPCEAIALYMWSGLMSASVYAFAVVFLRQCFGKENPVMNVLAASLILFACFCLVMLALVAMRVSKSKRRSALVPVAIGIVMGFLFVFAEYYLYKRWELLDRLEPWAVALAAACFVAAYAPCWVFWRKGNARLRAWAKEKAFRGLEEYDSGDRSYQAAIICSGKRKLKPPMLWAMEYSRSCAKKSDKKLSVAGACACATAVVALSMLPLQQVYLNFPIAIPMVSPSNCIYEINPMGNIVSAKFLDGSGQSNKYEYDVAGELYTERYGPEGRLRGIWNRVPEPEGQSLLFSDYMDLVENSGIHFAGTMDNDGKVVYRFDRVEDDKAKWRWEVVHYDASEDYRMDQSWHFTQDRDRTNRFLYKYSGGKIYEVDRYDEDDKLDGYFRPVFDSEGNLTSYNAYDLNWKWLYNTAEDDS